MFLYLSYEKFKKYYKYCTLFNSEDTFNLKLYCINKEIFKYQNNIISFFKEIYLSDIKQTNNISLNFLDIKNETILEEVNYKNRIIVYYFENIEEAFYFQMKYGAILVE